MKIKILSKITFCVLALTFCLISCQNDDTTHNSISGKKNFDTFAIYGNVHNALLHYASKNFQEPQVAPKSSNEALNYILEIEQVGLSELPLSENDKSMISDGLDKFKPYYVTDNLMKVIQPDTSRSLTTDEFSAIETEDSEDVTTMDIKAIIQQAYDNNTIDQFEYDSFLLLIDYVVENANGTLSNNEFETKINELIASWEIKYADVDFSQLEIETDQDILASSSSIDMAEVPQGAISGVVLNISKSSLDYWNEEQEQSRGLPVFVGADIAGALICAVSTSVGSYVTTGGIKWKSVAWGATSGAITGSTGIIGKAGKWISRLF